MRLPSFTLPFIPKPKLLVIGYGIVGKTVTQNLIDNDYNVEILDPSKNKHVRPYDCAGAIICVETTIRKDDTCDDSKVVEAIRVAEQLIKSKRIVVKSTITPDLVAAYPDYVVINPEFINKKNATEDFKHQKFMVWGGNISQIKWWDNVFKHIDCPRMITTREAACWIRYIHNSWLATKVVFFHELHKAAVAQTQLDDLRTAIHHIKRHDSQIGPSHMYAPNTDGTLGYKGIDFPNDMLAFSQFADTDLLKEVIRINDTLNTESI